MSLESIALIPSGYKATKVYSQLPVNGNGDFTFDRGTSTAQTRVNKNGLIEDVAQDVPRLDYLDGGCPSLLLEPSSTNLITYSEEFDNGAWIKINTSVTANAVLSPDGSVNADKLVNSATPSVNKFINFNPTNAVGVGHALSVFAKAGEYDRLRLEQGDNSRGAWFDLTNGTIGTENTDNGAEIIDYGNGWYRCVVYVDSVDTSIFFVIAGSNAEDLQVGDGTSGIYIYGAQLEQQSYATSYIPTSGATATRAAETCNGAGSTTEINSQEGVLFFEGRALADDLSFRAIALSDTSTANRVIFYYTNTSNKIICDLKVGGGVEFGANHTLIDITKYTKIAVSYKENEFKLYVNGLLVGLDASGSVPSSGVFSELAFDDGAGGSDFYGRVKKLSVYNSALNDSQLEALTGFTSFAEMASYLSYS